MSVSYAKLTVIVIEDDVNAQKTYRYMLESIGFKKILVAGDGNAGMLLLTHNFKECDLLICDWEMPFMSGLEILKDLREMDPKKPFLMITGRADMDSVRDARKYNVTGYIKKPFSLNELRKKLDHILGKEIGGDFYDRAKELMAKKGDRQALANALKYFKLAAESGMMLAYYDMANMYLKGIGVEQDDVLAFTCFKKAADHKVPQACFDLGVLYRDGLGTEQNDQAAFNAFLAAARYGHLLAQKMVATFYVIGKGTEVNDDEAYFWLSVAAKSKDRDAVNRQKEAAASIAPDKRANLDKCVAEWKNEA